MNTISVKCPKCQKTFGLKNTEGKSSVNIECPYCKSPIKVIINRKPIRLNTEGEQQRPQSGGDETMYKSQFTHEAAAQQPAYDKDDTEPYAGLASASMSPALLMDGKTYELPIGRNTVGRKAASSLSTLQLDTADRYMSRTNAIIDVARSLDGSWRVTISSSNERNLVKIDGHSIAMGDRIILQPGNTITLGHTNIDFTYKKK